VLIAVVAMTVCLCAPARAQGLGSDDLNRKNDGGYFTGLPLVNYTTDTGLGYGVRVYYYWNGHRGDPSFAHTPYLYRVFLQLFATTKGVQFHWLDFDAPKALDTPYRLRSELIYERVTYQNYFGLGDRSLQPLLFPGTGSKTYATIGAYNAAEQYVDPSGNAWTRYDEYDLLRPIGIASVERLFFHDRVRVLGGVGVSYASMGDYTGKSVAGINSVGIVEAPEGPTRLHTDCAAHLIVGCGGGWDNYLRFAASYDTRDFEPDPNRGVFVEAALDVGTAGLGGEYNYARGMLAARGYYSPIPDKADLVLAGRGVIVAQTSGAPFFSMDTLSFTDDPRTGLGGGRTLRGYLQDRFVGSVMTLLNGELRWTFWRTCIFKQKLAFIVVPFTDIGRPYDRLSELTLRDWRYTYGGALRVSWNLATLISVDYGISNEDTGLYISFNHMF
jgi:hypothetical protein